MTTKTLITIGSFLFFQFTIFQVFSQIDNLQDLVSKLETQKDTSRVNTLLKISYLLAKNSPNDAIVYAQKALKLSEKLNYTQGIGNSYHLIGLGYDYQSKSAEAIGFYQKSLTIKEKIKDKEGIAKTLNNLGILYIYISEFEKALDCFQSVLTVFEDLNKEENIAGTYNNFSICYTYLGDTAQASAYLLKALEVNQRIGNLSEVASNYNNIGFNTGLTNSAKALNYFKKALKINQEINNKRGESTTLYNIASFFLQLENIDSSIVYYNKGLQIATETNDIENLQFIYLDLSNIYEYKNQYQEAFLYFKKYTSLRDSVITLETNKKLAEMLTINETQRKEQEIIAQKAEIKNEKLIRNVSLLGLVLAVLFILIGIKYYYEKKQHNLILSKQNKIINNQNKEIEKQNKSLKIKNRAITDSIRYASRIQQAMLPPIELINNQFIEYFILFKPREIVSGDFYWFAAKQNNFYFAVADCTGHGVPGAMMSMLGLSQLNDIVSMNEEFKASEMLNILRERVIKSLHQTGQDEEAKDGMDISLCIYNQSNNSLNFSGAHNTAYILRPVELNENANKKEYEFHELKANRMPIGIHRKQETPFSDEYFELKAGDFLYLSTDGFSDQFDSTDTKKFSKKQLKETITNLCSLPISKHKDKLNQIFLDWKGDNDQIDDVTVMGIKF